MRYAVISLILTVSQLEAEVKRCSGKNLRIASASKQVFADLDQSAVGKLKAKGCIISNVGGVKADVMFPPVVTPPEPLTGAPIYTPEELFWFAGLEELRSLTEPPLYGEGMNLAIIGTGIRETHRKINGRVIYSKNYTTDVMGDGFDHDTGVCDIALAVVPQCSILNLRVLNDTGEGTEEDVAIAIDDCITMLDTNPVIAPEVINLSLGGPDDGNPDNPLRVACRAAIDRGIWIFASAGNGGPAPYTVTCPACEQYVGAVGSCGYEPFIISDWSSRGPTLEGLVKPDIVMFGENISMASSVSDTSIVAKSGTSFAVPIISAIAILYQEGVRRLVEVPGEIPPGIILAGQRLVSINEIIDNYIPNMCIKPQGVALEKDYDYGSGLVWGPLVYRAITVTPVEETMEVMLSSMGPIVAIGLLGAILGNMLKGVK